MAKSIADADFINLGFSGSAKGEPEIAEYISELQSTGFHIFFDRT